MRSNIVFLKSKNAFNRKEKERIERLIRETTRRAIKLLKIRHSTVTNFTIYPIEGKFTLGYAYSEDWIHLNVIKKFNENDLKSAVYHEMYHIADDFTFFAKKKLSLLDVLFSEGLAVAFEMEQVPKRIPVYAKYTDALIKKWLPEVKREKLNKNYSHDEWFWGKGKKPYQLGYRTGTYLVAQIKKHNPKLTADKLINSSTIELLNLSRIKL